MFSGCCCQVVNFKQLVFLLRHNTFKWTTILGGDGLIDQNQSYARLRTVEWVRTGATRTMDMMFFGPLNGPVFKVSYTPDSAGWTAGAAAFDAEYSSLSDKSNAYDFAENMNRWNVVSASVGLLYSQTIVGVNPVTDCEIDSELYESLANGFDWSLVANKHAYKYGTGVFTAGMLGAAGVADFEPATLLAAISGGDMGGLYTYNTTGPLSSLELFCYGSAEAGPASLTRTTPLDLLTLGSKYAQYGGGGSPTVNGGRYQGLWSCNKVDDEHTRVEYALVPPMSPILDVDDCGVTRALEEAGCESEQPPAIVLPPNRPGTVQIPYEPFPCP